MNKNRPLISKFSENELIQEANICNKERLNSRLDFNKKNWKKERDSFLQELKNRNIYFKLDDSGHARIID